ncbi:MAG: toll/interleukin-1 receptor domain-containing protein [Ruminococcus sp.]|nr:toll/interleukin-1 receptor domain-containing protein [Ruminococcus sp.]
MVSATTFQRYIIQCDSIIEQNDVGLAKALGEEIVSVFHNEIDGIKTGLSNYSPCMFGSAPDGRTISVNTDVDYIADLRLLRSKLQMELEKSELCMQTNMDNKNNKIFISHATKDSEYVRAFVNLLEDIGLSEDEIVCSSVPGYGIPLSEDIYDWLSNQFQEYNLHIMFMLSKNYYDSVACLNEMGAAWVLKQKYDTILLPSFDFPQIKGAINPNKIGIKLDSVHDELNHRLNEMKDTLIEEFELRTISASKWERHRNEFLKKIEEITTDSNENEPEQEKEQQESTISRDAGVLLVFAASNSYGQISMIKSLSGLSVSDGKWNFVAQDADAREESRWEDAVIELENYGLITALGYKRQLFRITTLGYNIADEIKEKYGIDTDKEPDEYLNLE